MYETDEPTFALWVLTALMGLLAACFIIMGIALSPKDDSGKRCYLMRAAAVESVKVEKVECPNP